MTDPRTRATRGSYDRIAASYRDRFQHELNEKPFDRGFLDRMAGLASHGGWVVDLGCGPGQVGAYLARQGMRVLSLDLSSEMVRQSRALLPGASQVQADMRTLPFASRSIHGIVAFFSLIHIPPAELGDAIAEMRRVLAPGGHLAITTHATPPADRAGPSAQSTEGALHVEQMLDAPVDLDFFFYGSDRLRVALEHTEFKIIECTEREHYGPEVEAQTRRAYLLAQKSE